MTAEEALSLMLEAGTDEAAWQVLQELTDEEVFESVALKSERMELLMGLSKELTDEEVFELVLLVSSLDREVEPS